MAKRKSESYELYYWPGIPGRGEFVRLVFEDAGAPYVDVGRLSESEGGGMSAVRRLLEGELGGVVPFAPPAVKFGEHVVAQTPLLGHILGCRFGLAPPDDAGRTAALQHAMTLADFVVEAHDVHHPLGASLYYEDQKPEAARRAQVFRDERMAEFLGYFERVLEQNRAGDGQVLVGDRVTYVDLYAFQVLEGLGYAFPNAYGRRAHDFPRLNALRSRVAERPRLGAYLASDRRTPFNERGIFRHYPELDPA
ncbi:MAG: glutathione S-transferase [Myxococcota bacterium]